MGIFFSSLETPTFALEILCGTLLSRRTRIGLVAGLAMLLIGSLPLSARGQVKDARVGDSAIPVRSVFSDGKDCGLRKTDIASHKSIRPDRSVEDSATATIKVNYSGFPPKARRAFDRAVEVWETRIQSDVTIRIGTYYQLLGEGVLGGMTPVRAYPLDTDQDDEFEMAAFDALADALTGENQGGKGPDFFVSMNRGRDDWHFGDGDAPPGKIDFTSVVVHEIAHGLGYFAVQTVYEEGAGAYGVNLDQVEDGRIPSVYTTFLAQQRSGGDRTSLVDESLFPNPSPGLGDAMTSDAVVFEGPASASVAEQNPGPILPKIYAPSPYKPGSSISHLDEETYLSSGSNGLMTPYLGTAETIRRPGPVVCGQLRDLGWSLGPGCLRNFRDVYGLHSADPPDLKEGSVSLAWESKNSVRIQEYIVERKYFDGPFTPIKRVESPPVTIDSLGLGTFTFRVRWIRADGSEGTTVRSIRTTFEPKNVSARIASTDDQGRATVWLAWEAPPGTENASYRVERRSGPGGPFVKAASTTSTSKALRQQTPGTYRYRVTAVDDAGNMVFGEEEQKVQIDFEGATYVLGPYPNPVQKTATLDLTAREAQPVTIRVYNAIGEQLYADRQRLGTKTPTSIRIDVRSWSSGLYILRIEGNTFTRTRKMTVVK